KRPTKGGIMESRHPEAADTGGSQPVELPLQEKVGGRGHFARRIAEVQMKMTSQCELGARQTMSTLIACILAVAYQELDELLRATQQPQE
ncbi:hypothetical protein NDU88_002536, partial [Pleurodeles waltl]